MGALGSSTSMETAPGLLPQCASRCSSPGGPRGPVGSGGQGEAQGFGGEGQCERMLGHGGTHVRTSFTQCSCKVSGGTCSTGQVPTHKQPRASVTETTESVVLGSKGAFVLFFLLKMHFDAQKLRREDRGVVEVNIHTEMSWIPRILCYPRF